jgi:hypothetical protein
MPSGDARVRIQILPWRHPHDHRAAQRALTLVYLHQVHGIALPVVGALLAVSAAAGLAWVHSVPTAAPPPLIFGASMGPTGTCWPTVGCARSCSPR